MIKYCISITPLKGYLKRRLEGKLRRSNVRITEIWNSDYKACAPFEARSDFRTLPISRCLVGKPQVVEICGLRQRLTVM